MDTTEATERPGLRRWVLPVITAALGVALLVYLLVPYGDDFRGAASRASPGSLALLAAMSLVALGLRTEMWGVALRACGHSIPRSQLHAANAGTFLVSLVNGYVGPAVKLWLLRRMRPRGEQRLVQLVAIDFAAALLEVLVAAVLVVFAAIELDLAWWLPVGLVGGGLALVGVVVATYRRWYHHPAVQGFNVVMHSYYRYRLLALLAGVFAAQILRTWLALDAVGVDASVTSATLLFVVAAVLGVLPTGLAAAPTAASVLVLGRDGVGAAAAAGVLITGALLLATVLYTVLTVGWYLRARSRDVRSVDARPRDSSSPRPAPGR